jgi:hypothetical protein
MSRAYSILLFLLWPCAASLLAREPTAQDYDVWNAVVSSYSRSGSAYVWHLVEPTSVFDRGATKFAFEFLPEARPTAEAWHLPARELYVEGFQAAAKRVRHRFFEPPPVKLLDAATLNRIAEKSPGPAWLVSPLLIPNSEAVIRLSWPAYREDGRAAFLICVVCTEWWGSVIQLKIDKDFLSGEWRLGQSARRNFTHWKDGKLFDDEWPQAASNSKPTDATAAESLK